MYIILVCLIFSYTVENDEKFPICSTLLTIMGALLSKFKPQQDVEAKGWGDEQTFVSGPSFVYD